MAAIQGEQAIQRLAATIERAKPEAGNFLAKAGEQFDEACARLRARVETDGKACKAKVTITVELHAYRSKGGEVAVEVAARPIVKMPDEPRVETMVFLDKDGHAHTVPQQVDMPLFDPKASVIEGGKDKSDSAPKARGKAV